MQTAEQIVAERAAKHLPTRMRVRHPMYGEIEVSAYSRMQAEAMAANIWGKCWWSIADEIKTSVVLHGVTLEGN